MTHTAKICKSFWGLIIVIALFFVGCQKLQHGRNNMILVCTI